MSETPLKKYKRRCSAKGRVHVLRFNRYAGPFDYTVHPNDPARKPNRAVFRCVECGYEAIVPIRHKP